MICHNKKFIFVHIPKCGGTTISKALNIKRDHGTIKMVQPLGFNLPYYFFIDFFNILRKIRYQAKNRNKLSQLASYNFNNYFKFSIVRNPWSRAFSGIIMLLEMKITEKI